MRLSRRYGSRVAYRVRITTTARIDLLQAYDWMLERSPRGAVRWLDGIQAAIRTLTRNPKRCSLAPESDAFAEPIHQFLYGKRHSLYRVLFRIDKADNVVDILHVRHAARLPIEPNTEDE
jgi:plasmid stabilization system protein ParE